MDRRDSKEGTESQKLENGKVWRELIELVQVRERAEEILKEENEEERQKLALMERTCGPEKGILFRRNENNNVYIRILQGRRLGP